ncbi:hypothetical protein CMQ_875 [Grosmannia clavigera kw1407]|uniref:Nascent polypeptide-associated complex subunit alpha-like UBA domain-containing protein n=1 Tax=Grosmannia clavigera (strain kw1407 / UAMH 11150) TaxID=655863 RepID=F0XDI9_GROCL|nr:uncharacterized protein CMQ_875 [Grosmannia clavigera kw1407]EFX03947.1 hypothetical protein CMQ_875 [Grosmannia clavigera kw1407]
MSTDPKKPAEVEDEAEDTGKTAEDRALASLDAVGPQSDESTKHVDHEAVSKAMKNLKLGTAAAATKKVKVDAADVALLVNELDLTKAKATDLLKNHDGNAVSALRAFVTVN